MAVTRRDFLRTSGAFVVSFAFTGVPNVGLAQAGGLSPSLRGNPLLHGWIRMSADGAVRAFPGKCELGQGIGTALAQIVADELDLSFDSISVESVDTDESPNESYTYGSLSIQHSGSAFRQVAAEMRHILLSNAAKHAGVARDRLTVANGRFLVDGVPLHLRYVDLLHQADFDVEVTGEVRPKTQDQYHHVGRSVSRLDLPGKVFGKPSYIQDLRLPGMLHARVVRPRSQAYSLDRLKEHAVASLPGVRAVVRDGSFLAVVAEREEQAIHAATRLSQAAVWKQSSQPGESLYDSPHGLRGGRKEESVVHQTGGSAAMPVRELVADYSKLHIAHASISPSAAIAHWDNDRLTVWSHGQGMFPLRGAIAKVVNLPENKVRLKHREASGCYGQNGADDAACDAAVIAMHVPGEIVRLQWSRRDEFRYEPLGTAMSVRLAAGVDDSGEVTHWHHDVWSATHSSRPGGAAGAGNLIAAGEIAEPLQRPPPRNLQQPSGGGDRNAVPLYTFVNQKVTKHFLLDSPRRVSALRGLGAYANVFAIESFVDQLAQLAGKDPVAFRIAHLKDERAIDVLHALRGALAQAPEQREGFSGGRGLGFARYKNLGAYAGVVCEVQLNRSTGQVLVTRAHVVVDAGLVVNPDGVRNQIEGGVIQSTSWTLKEMLRLSGRTDGWSQYEILRFSEVPMVSVDIIESEAPSLGAGEAVQGPMAGAIGNAIAAATGLRLRDLPFSPQRVLEALERVDPLSPA